MKIDYIRRSDYPFWAPASYRASYYFERAKKEREKMKTTHRCNAMVVEEDFLETVGEARPYLMYMFMLATEEWVLLNKNEQVRRGALRCEYCKQRLGDLTTEGLTRSDKHRCIPMRDVEHRRNSAGKTDKAQKDRSYHIAWDCFDGWTLYNRGAKTDKRRKLIECPYCHVNLPQFNEVIIE